jgi:glycosyltransferase involved in cell wall biosynthesis
MPNLEYDVVICTYNGAKYIEKQITSILAQHIEPNCFYIADDGSTDNTIDICEKILVKSGVNYKITKNKKNLGFARNFMKHARLCNAPIVFFCDQDDVWHEDKVNVFKNYIDKNNEGLLFFSNAYLTDESLCLGKYCLWDLLPIPKKSIITYTDGLDKNFFVTGATMAIRRKLLDVCPDCPVGVYHDAWLSIVASIKGVVVPIPDKLILYRQHSSNLLGAHKKNIIERFIGVLAPTRKQVRKNQILQRILILQQLKSSKLLSDKEAEMHLDFLNKINHIIESAWINKIRLVVYYPKYKLHASGLKELLVDFFL